MWGNDHSHKQAWCLAELEAEINRLREKMKEQGTSEGTADWDDNSLRESGEYMHGI